MIEPRVVIQIQETVDLSRVTTQPLGQFQLGEALTPHCLIKWPALRRPSEAEPQSAGPSWVWMQPGWASFAPCTPTT